MTGGEHYTELFLKKLPTGSSKYSAQNVATMPLVAAGPAEIHLFCQFEQSSAGIPTGSLGVPTKFTHSFKPAAS